MPGPLLKPHSTTTPGSYVGSTVRSYGVSRKRMVCYLGTLDSYTGHGPGHRPYAFAFAAKLHLLNLDYIHLFNLAAAPANKILDCSLRPAIEVSRRRAQFAQSHRELSKGDELYSRAVSTVSEAFTNGCMFWPGDEEGIAYASHFAGRSGGRLVLTEVDGFRTDFEQGSIMEDLLRTRPTGYAHGRVYDYVVPTKTVVKLFKLCVLFSAASQSRHHLIELEAARLVAEHAKLAC